MKTNPQIIINTASRQNSGVSDTKEADNTLKASSSEKSNTSVTSSPCHGNPHTKCDYKTPTIKEKRANCIGNFETPTDWNNMLETVQYISEKYPFVSVSYLGTSLLGRKIPLIKLGNESAERYVLYVGSHHGCEHITTSVLLKFCLDYCAQHERNSSVYGVSLNNLFSSALICVVPMLNPDGVEIAINGASSAGVMAQRINAMNRGGDFRKWKANVRGVDLNHNYSTGFKEYKKLEHESKINAGAEKYSGEFAESETETGCLCNYIRFNDNIKGCLTLHTQGEVIYSGNNNKHIAGKLLERITGYRLSEPEGTAMYGGLTDWLTSEMNIPSYTLECGKGENPLPQSQVSDIYLRIREALFSFPVML